jgi:hypothetical protein
LDHIDCGWLRDNLKKRVRRQRRWADWPKPLTPANSINYTTITVLIFFIQRLG